jgi:hypothetical protein
MRIYLWTISSRCLTALRNKFFRRGFLRPFDSTQGEQAQDEVTLIHTGFHGWPARAVLVLGFSMWVRRRRIKHLRTCRQCPPGYRVIARVLNTQPAKNRLVWYSMFGRSGENNLEALSRAFLFYDFLFWEIGNGIIGLGIFAQKHKYISICVYTYGVL